MKYQDFPVATEGFHFFLPARFGVNEISLTLSVSVREREV